MCPVLTRMSRQQSQLWQGSVSGSQLREEGPSPPQQPHGCSHWEWGKDSHHIYHINKNFSISRCEAAIPVSHSPNHLPQHWSSAGPWDEDTGSGELISQSWKSQNPTATISSDVPANTSVSIILPWARLPGERPECSCLDPGIDALPSETH